MILKLIEFLFLFIALPLLVYFEPLPLPKIPALVGVTLICFAILMFDKSFDRKLLWNNTGIKSHLKHIILRSVIVFVIVVAATWLLIPEWFFQFPIQRPIIWLLVMLLYPFLSAYPQELVYRTFLFHRYKNLFPKKAIFWVSVVSFSFLHIIFDNWVAVTFTLGGGYLFTKTYDETKSLAVTSIEHAIYGCIVFTVGLGRFFYEGG